MMGMEADAIWVWRMIGIRVVGMEDDGDGG